MNFQRISLIVGALISVLVALALVRVDFGQRQHVDRGAVRKYGECRSIVSLQNPNLAPADLDSRCADLAPPTGR